jgi:phosphatidylglycerol:prolipoprotein diacylglycerol transferase
MWPTLYQGPGGVGLHNYGLMILLAFCSAFLLVNWRARQVGYHPDRLIVLYVAAAVGGMTGGRLLYVLAVEPSILWNDPSRLFAFSGFAVYGGTIGGTLAVAAAARAQGLSIWKMADIAAPAVVLGYGVGRLGCFFAGCCHGAAIDLQPRTPLLPDGLLYGQIFWSPHFPFLTTQFDAGVGRLLHQPLYPTQLWAVVALCTLAAVLSSMWGKRRFDGQLFALMLLLESSVRIFIESFRADQRGYLLTVPVSPSMAAWLPGLASAGDAVSGARMGITTSQGIGLAMITLGVVLHVVRWNAGILPEAEVDDDEDADLPAPTV